MRKDLFASRSTVWLGVVDRDDRVSRRMLVIAIGMLMGYIGAKGWLDSSFNSISPLGTLPVTLIGF